MISLYSGMNLGHIALFKGPAADERHIFRILLEGQVFIRTEGE